MSPLTGAIQPTNKHAELSRVRRV